jgi:hypothetical protein
MASCMETRVGNEEEAPVWAEENKALVRRFLEAQATSDLETLDELLAPDFVDHTLLPGQDPSRQGYLRAIAEDHAALSDIGTTIEYQATDGDDIVITRHTAHSIHDRGRYWAWSPLERSGSLRTSTCTASQGARSSRRGVRAAPVRSWRNLRKRCASASALRRTLG